MQGECRRKKRDRLGGLSRLLSHYLNFFRQRVPRSEVSPPVASAQERGSALVEMSAQTRILSIRTLHHVIIVKCPQSFSLCQHPITTRCEPSAIPGAFSFWVEKPGRIFCFKGAEQISSIKIWNGEKCVPFEISFSVFLKRLDTNI